MHLRRACRPQLRAIIVLLKLLQPLGERLGQRLPARSGHLELHHHARLAGAHGPDHHVGATLTRLAVGAHLIGWLEHGEQAHDEPSIDSLRVDRAWIVVREQVADEGLELLFEELRVAVEQGPGELIEAASVPLHALRQPAPERGGIDQAHLAVGDREQVGRLLHRALRALFGLEVAREHQEAPERVFVVADLGQDHVLVEHALDDAAFEQRLEHGLELDRVVLEDLVDEIVGAGREPVRLGALVAAVEEAQQRPRVVDDLSAEEIPVVPGAHLVQLVGSPRPLEQRRDLGLGEAEAGVVRGREQGIDAEVVQARKEALPGHAEDACHHRLEEVEVALEASAEEGPQELQDARGVAVEVAGVDRLVVLVDEDDDLLAVVGVEVGGEIEERAIVEGLVG